MKEILPKVGTNPPPKTKSPGLPGSNNKRIELKFCEGFNAKLIRIITLNSYEDFFNFFVENSEKGLIYDVQLIENSPWLELQELCIDFAKKNNLTYDDVLEAIEKVRNEETNLLGRQSNEEKMD